jgi:hypothetical protein
MGDFRESLEREWQDALRARERAARRAVEEIYGHRALERDERPVALFEQDLFSVDQWFLWGLNRRQLVASGAAGGAAVGGVIDAAAHGASLLAGALIGAAIGGAGAWWSSSRLARVRVFALPLGGQLLRCGPAASPNFPYVVLGRALHHHARIAGRAHAVRSPLALGRRTGRELDRSALLGSAPRARPELPRAATRWRRRHRGARALPHADRRAGRRARTHLIRWKAESAAGHPGRAREKMEHGRARHLRGLGLPSDAGSVRREGSDRARWQRAARAPSVQLDDVNPDPYVDEYVIREEDGGRYGNNLLQSFTRFDLVPSCYYDCTASATFTGSPGIENIVARVTGGESSLIQERSAPRSTEPTSTS